MQPAKSAKPSKWRFLKGSIIVIEGNIASGKSTLTDNLVSYLISEGLDARLYKEPILQSYLDAFILNQPKYAFGFQMSMLIENQCLYADALDHSRKGGVAIMDRSFLGNRVFAEVQKNKGNINDDDFKIYEDVFNRMDAFPKPDYIVYLKVNPQVNARRCKLRDRSCEADNYDIGYFQSLNDRYDDLISRLRNEHNIIELEWSRDRTIAEQKMGTMEVLTALRSNLLE